MQRNSGEQASRGRPTSTSGRVERGGEGSQSEPQLSTKRSPGACTVTRHAKGGDKKPMSTRSRLDIALQIDQNHSEGGNGSGSGGDRDLVLDKEELDMLQALNSFVPIPSLSLGVVRPVSKDSLEVEDDLGPAKR